jgi:hypothetical protein
MRPRSTYSMSVQSPVGFSRKVMLGSGMVLGLLGSSSGPACIIPDYCIVWQTPGTDWCVNVEVAHMWPINQPELAEPVRSESGGLVKGCRCFNDGEHVILNQQAPAEIHAELVEELEEAGRSACAWAVPPGYDHDCFILDDSLGPVFSAPYDSDPSVDCVGSCGYLNPPPNGSCGEDPDPWACNEDGSGETGEGDGDVVPAVTAAGSVTP